MQTPVVEDKVKSLSSLSEVLLTLSKDLSMEVENVQPGWVEKFRKAVDQSVISNAWFTEDAIREALNGLGYMLRPEALEKWVASYQFSPVEPKRIGLILAGNIPLVGFHDVFSVLMAGHLPVVKRSSQDQFLLPVITELMQSLVPSFQIEWADGKLPEVDAVIATGSNNTSRYFEYYFKKYPNIIRKNRSSVAIIDGTESKEELELLGQDIFSFYGLGCRSVSKVYIKNDFDLDRLFNALYKYHPVINHHKYANNFDYYRALWMMNREDLLENGFLLLRPSDAIASPISTLFYERFDDEDMVRETLNSRAEEIQCIVSKKDIPFGQSQKPELWDYADGVDTLDFLLKL